MTGKAEEDIFVQDDAYECIERSLYLTASLE